jgi:DNA topoisomerase VI subunit A
MKKKEDVNVVVRIDGSANKVLKTILKKEKPTMSFPIRSLNNVEYDPKVGFFELKGKEKERTLTVNTVKAFAQTLRMMSVSKELISAKDIATKREMYYISKNWGDAKFKEQPESDSVMDDIEAMFRINREQMGFIPGDHGGSVAGDLVIVDREDDGKELLIDCTKFGSGAYSIPATVEHLKFKTEAKFVLAIETSGMFERLNKHKYWKKSNCIIIAMSGVPTRATRRFIRKLSDEQKIPVYVFTDGDPYGYLNIYRTLKVGSGNAAHINEYFCVPQAQFIGVTPQDIDDYKLPTHKLKDVDIKRIKDGIKNDPFVMDHKEWQKALQLMTKKGQRVEQQAFAKFGLNYVMEKYLPEKLSNKKTWLP